MGWVGELDDSLGVSVSDCVRLCDLESGAQYLHHPKLHCTGQHVNIAIIVTITGITYVVHFLSQHQSRWIAAAALLAQQNKARESHAVRTIAACNATSQEQTLADKAS